MRYGMLCPALLTSRAPVPTWRQAAKAVTNMDRSFSRHSSRFIRATTAERDASVWTKARNSVLVTAMRRAAATPFPETSPTMNHSRSSSARNS